MVALGDQVDAAAAVVVAFQVGFGQAIADADVAIVGVADADEQIILPQAAVDVDLPAVGFQTGHGMEGIFQTVGQQRTKVGIRKPQMFGQLDVDSQAHTGTLGFVGKGRTEQIDHAVFTEGAQGQRVDALLYGLDIGSGLFDISDGQKTVDGHQVMAHIVAVDGRADLRIVEQADLGAGSLQLLAVDGTGILGAKGGVGLAEGVDDQDIDQQHQGENDQQQAIVSRKTLGHAGDLVGQDEQDLESQRDQRKDPPVDIGGFEDLAMVFFQHLLIEHQIEGQQQDAQAVLKRQGAESQVADKHGQVVDNGINIDPQPEIEKGLGELVPCDQQKKQEIRNGDGPDHHAAEKCGTAAEDEPGIDAEARHRHRRKKQKGMADGQAVAVHGVDVGHAKDEGNEQRQNGDQLLHEVSSLDRSAKSRRT